MSNKILLPLETFSKKHPSTIASQYSDSSKEEVRSHSLNIGHDAYHSQDQSNSSSSGLGSGSESGASINGESETSDYQRSTPSPRDDPFQEQSLEASKNTTKVLNPKDDLGFVEDLSNEDNSLHVSSKSKVYNTKSSYNQKYQENNTAKNQVPTPKKVKTKIGLSPKSFYKSSSQGAKISKLINDANNSFSLKRNRSKCDLNPKLNQDVSMCNEYKKKSSDLNRSQNKCNIVVSKKAPATSKNVLENRKEKISNNANQKTFSESIVKGCERNGEKVKRIHDRGHLQHLPHSSSESTLNQNGKSRNFGEIPLSSNKHNCKRRASEADLEDNSKHSKHKSHKRSKSSSSRRRNDIKHILTNYQNRLLQQRHQDHQARTLPSNNVSSPIKSSSVCNIIKPAKLTNVVTPTKLSSLQAQVPIHVQQTIVKSSKSQSIIMLPPNSSSFPTQQINTAFNKQMIIMPSPNNMSSQLPAFYHHQSEVRTSFTSNIIVPSSSINPNCTRNNPFLPPSEVKSSFLFGNNDEFETADGDDLALDDEVILAMGSESSSEDSDDEDDDLIIYSPIDDDGISLEEDRIIPKLPKISSSSNTDQLLPNNTSLKTSQTICQRDLDSNVTCKEKKEIKSTTMNGPMMQMNGKDLALYEKGASKNVDIKVEKEGIFTNNKVSAKDCDNVSDKKIRFPAMQGPTNMIECKWLECQMSFTTYGRLSDHLKAVHVIGQVSECNEKLKENDEAYYKCLWSDCKVYNMASCSMSWLEKHVPIHGGKFSYPCIVSGCKMRFSSQKILQRHVNQHFAAQEDKNATKKTSENNVNSAATRTPSTKSSKKGSSSSKFLDSIGPYGVKALLETQNGDVYLARKSVVNPAAMKFSSSTKNLKRVGVRLKYRKSMFSARNFDFFDAGVMAGVKDAVNTLEVKSRDIFSMNSKNVVTFEASEILATRKNGPSKKRSVLVKWTPENLLENEWVEISDHRHKPIRKRMRLCNLPEAAKSTIREKLFGVHPSSQIFSEHNEKTKDDTKDVDTSWIKTENDKESTSIIHERNASNNIVSDKDQHCKRKHSRKYKPLLSLDVVSRSHMYNSSFPRPPKGLF